MIRDQYSVAYLRQLLRVAGGMMHSLILISLSLVGVPFGQAFLGNFDASSSSWRQPVPAGIGDRVAARPHDHQHEWSGMRNHKDPNVFILHQYTQPPPLQSQVFLSATTGYQFPPSWREHSVPIGYPNMPLLDEGGPAHGNDPFHNNAMNVDMAQPLTSYQPPPEHGSDMSVAHSDGFLPQGSETGVEDSGAGWRNVGRTEEHNDQEEESESPQQQPQKARRWRPRMQWGERHKEEPEEEQQQPATARISTSNRGNERKLLADNRKWLLQQWKDRNMRYSMPAQFLAQGVTEIKIRFPNKSRQVGMTSNRWVDEAMAEEEDYLFDYHAWINTYQDHITRLRKKYAAQGLVEGSDAMIVKMLAEYKYTHTKQHATLGNPRLEELDVQYSRRVWNEFVKDRLRAALDAGGDPSDLDLIAKLSWDYQSLSVNNFEAIKYINKYLRCVMHMSVKQLAQLKALQEREEAEKGTRKGRRRGSRVQS